MEFNTNEKDIVNEVLIDHSSAERTVQRLKEMLGAESKELTGDKSQLLDYIAVYDKAITFYKQNTTGTTVNTPTEQDSRINDMIKKGLKHG